jgi:hydrogenase maturation protease
VSATAPVLIVGVGSELRSDDAAGRRVVEVVAGRALPGVEVRSVHQLTPELAADLVDRQLVVVVDADVEVTEVTVRPVERRDAAGVMTHHLDPAALVGLAGWLGPPPAEVVVVSVPTHDLSLGTELSVPTAVAVEVAADEVVRRCRRAGPLG